uniref:Translin-associated factor X-interacting protein 1 N-terminal domain-containing protein n=1 Tax=Leptobrachium leishanense TaxID=445787 RepID=A0A8C5MMJ4_9ANUR
MIRTKQQEKIIKLDKLLDGIEIANKKDTEAYTSGHLNHNHMYKPPLLTKKAFWTTATKPNHLLLSQLSPLTHGKEKDKKKMRDTPTNIALRTRMTQNHKAESKSTFLPSITNKSKILNNSFSGSTFGYQVHGSSKDNGEFQESTVHQDELGHPCIKSFNLEYGADMVVSSQYPIHESELLPSYLTGATKTDQFNMFLEFNRNFLKIEDGSKNMSTDKYETEIVKKLSDAANFEPSHVARLQIFSETFENICRESTIYGSILHKVKYAYDMYIAYLMDAQCSTQLEMLMSEISSMRKRTVKTQDVQETYQSVCNLQFKALHVLENNDLLRNHLKKEITSVQSKEKLKEPEIHFEAQLAQDKSKFENKINLLDLKRREVLTICNEVRCLEEEIHKNMTHAVNYENTSQYIKEMQAETVKLQSTNEFLHQANKKLDYEIRKALTKQKMPLETQMEIKKILEIYLPSEEQSKDTRLLTQ